MIAIDTNVVVRLLVADDPEQHARAAALLSETVCFIPDTVLLETVWVLRSVYVYPGAAIAGALRRLLGLPNVRLADAERVRQALAWYAEGLDFADALHLASAQEAEAFATFDRRFVDRAGGRGACPVREV